VPLKFAIFELTPETGELRKRGSRVRLAPQPLTVLTMLASRAGEVVTRDELRAALWGDNTFIEFDQGLNTCIRQIRTALGDDADAPRFVETLPRRGYRFLPHVESIGHQPQPAPPPAAALPPAPLDEPVSPAASPRRRWMMPVAAVAVMAAIGAAAIGIPRLRNPREATPSASPQTIAVLPLANLTKDKEDDVLADGVTEALIHDLAQVQSLRVISRTSVMRFKQADQPLGVIAKQLGADLVIEGSFQEDGDRIRITLQLVEAATDLHRFSRTFETKSDKLFDTERMIARQVADAVATTLTPTERERLTVNRSVDPEAYREYLLGRHFWNRRGLDNLRTAESHFTRAVQIDPSFALGYAALAETYVLLGDSENNGLQPAQASKLTHDAAARALQIDPSLAEAYAAEALALLMFDWNWTASERQFKRALELGPQSTTTWSWYGRMLTARGRFDEAIDAYERARLIDPLSLAAQTSAGYAYWFARRFDEALERIDAALQMDPTFVEAVVMKGRVLETLGKFAEARELYDAFLKIGADARIDLAIVRCQANTGDMEGARAKFVEMRKGRTSAEMPAMFRMFEAFSLNNYDEGFKALDAAVDEHTFAIVTFLAGPSLDGFSDDRRLKALVQRVNPELQAIKRLSLAEIRTR
jgi:TolB-like protein/DNA-binding winged helix-turn-helix (wHTH) protein/Tfp pilus assembly protein PilF